MRVAVVPMNSCRSRHAGIRVKEHVLFLIEAATRIGEWRERDMEREKEEREKEREREREREREGSRKTEKERRFNCRRVD